MEATHPPRSLTRRESTKFMEGIILTSTAPLVNFSETYHLQDRHCIILGNIKAMFCPDKVTATSRTGGNGQENPARSDRHIAVAKKWFVSTQSNYMAGCKSERRHKAEKRMSEGAKMCDPSVLTTDSFYFSDGDDDDDSHSTIRLRKRSHGG